MSKTTNKYSLEVRERAVRLVLDNEGRHASRWQAVTSIAAKIGCTPQTLNDWVKKAEVDSGRRAGIPTEMAEKMKALERENRDLRQANEILRKASAYFAMSDKDRAAPKSVGRKVSPFGRSPNLRLDSLNRAGWLSEQPADFQLRMAELGRWASIPRGRQLYSAGDEPDALYGIGTGLLDIAIPIIGEEDCIIHRARAGFWIGDGALIPGEPRTLTVEAATDCRLFRVPFPVLRRHLTENPGDWEYMHRLSTLNATLAVRLLAEVLSLPPSVRVARLLLRLAAPDGTVASTHEELGRLAGMSRATFARSLSRMMASGAIETRYNAIRIADLSAVEAEAKIGTP